MVFKEQNAFLISEPSNAVSDLNFPIKSGLSYIAFTLMWANVIIGSTMIEKQHYDCGLVTQRGISGFS